MTTDEILRGLRKLRGTARTQSSADILDAAIARIEELDGALTEALDEWASWYEDQRHGGQALEHPRIVELRKLTRKP